MLGIIYLLLAGMLGCEASKMLTGEGKSVSGINRIWLMLPASFGVGTLLLTWMVYIISWFFSVVGKAENPLLYGNIIGMTGAAVIMILLSVQKYRKQGSYRIWNIDKTQDKRRLKKEILLFGLLTVFITYMMFYVFYIKDGILYSGLTVYGDYAPHTAMMRSFSAGNNFPTQYPHYGGADVKYHFMFQFLTGNLEYLGMRMDFAYNIVSTLSLVGFLMLLYQLLTADALYLTGQNSTRRTASKRRPSRIPRMISINLRISHKICNIFSPVFYIFSCCEGSRFPVHFIDQTSHHLQGFLFALRHSYDLRTDSIKALLYQHCCRNNIHQIHRIL